MTDHIPHEPCVSSTTAGISFSYQGAIACHINRQGVISGNLQAASDILEKVFDGFHMLPLLRAIQLLQKTNHQADLDHQLPLVLAPTPVAPESPPSP